VQNEECHHQGLKKFNVQNEECHHQGWMSSLGLQLLHNHQTPVFLFCLSKQLINHVIVLTTMSAIGIIDSKLD
jgi:hypothetical protein